MNLLFVKSMSTRSDHDLIFVFEVFQANWASLWDHIIAGIHITAGIFRIILVYIPH